MMKKKKAFKLYNIGRPIPNQSGSISFSPSLCYPSCRNWVKIILLICLISTLTDDELSGLEVWGCDHEDANSVDRSSEKNRIGLLLLEVKTQEIAQILSDHRPYRLCNSSKYMKTTSNSPNRSQKSNRAFRTEPEHLREHAKEETNAISYEPGVENTLRRNTSSNPFRYTRNHTEITHSPICFMVILA
ncbi:hypothetical protein Bca4012_001511 [Brassica carinata]